MTTTRVTARPLASPIAHAIDRMTTLARALDEGMPATAGASPTWIPALELAERADAYLIAAELPGVREDAIELSFENNVLTIRGTKAGLFEEARDGSLRRHLVERQTGAFQRETGWQPRVDAHDGIQRLYEWLAARQDKRSTASAGLRLVAGAA